MIINYFFSRHNERFVCYLLSKKSRHNENMAKKKNIKNEEIIKRLFT